MNTSKKTALIWFRKDLRLADNAALTAACAFEKVIPLYIIEESDSEWSMGGASKWWLHQSLIELGNKLQEHGSQLLVLKGKPQSVLEKVVSSHKVDAVFWNRRYQPNEIELDKSIKESFKSSGVAVESFNNSLLREPWVGTKSDGTAYQVYTPYWRNFLTESAQVPKPLRTPKIKPLPPLQVKGLEHDKWHLLSSIGWDTEFYERWNPGEEYAKKNLLNFVKAPIQSYNENRDLPALSGTSSMSPHLAFGEITARQIWHEIIRKHGAIEQLKSNDVIQYAKEIVWREFAYHLMFHFPQTTNNPLRENFKKFPWSKDKKALAAWQKGLTGYPIVDAGMRQLWRTGWMHNRVRMIVASFLVKHLRISWLEGARWFWDTLVDADLASNTMGWQWAGGCGADAAPYFRIFNPITQGEKFDPEGVYTKEFVPELSHVPTKNLYQPWQIDKSVLSKAEVTLGKNYPKPIVIHTEARIKALKAFESVKTSR